MRLAVAVVAGLIIMTVSDEVAAQWTLVKEPAVETNIVWDVKPNGMLVIGFDLNGDGRPELYTSRIVVTSYFSAEPPERESAAFPKNILFKVDYEQDAYFYVVEAHPILYSVDLNGDGVWDIVYKDVAADGVNGNEVLYDSPSGMFSVCSSACEKK